MTQEQLIEENKKYYKYDQVSYQHLQKTLYSIAKSKPPKAAILAIEIKF